jgi:short-subunit dehydrogenase
MYDRESPAWERRRDEPEQRELVKRIADELATVAAPPGPVAGLGCGPGAHALALARRHRGEMVLITGASSGIGRELARQFAGDGADLVLIARSQDRLRDLAGELTAECGVTVEVVPADLTRSGSPDQIVETLAQQQIDVDVLVSNAGFGARGPVAGLGAGRQREMIGVNVAALTRLTALLLPGMLERRRGGILTVASTAAFRPGPDSAVYYAAKAYVLSLTEALAGEVRLRQGAHCRRYGRQAGDGSLAVVLPPTE